MDDDLISKSGEEVGEEWGPLLVSVSDIDVNNPESYNLESIGYMLGIMDMRQAMVFMDMLQGHDGQTVMLLVTPENFMETLQKLYSLAIFNYACELHEKFIIPSIIPDMVKKYHRSYTVAQHDEALKKYLTQVMMLLEAHPDWV